MMLAFLRVPKTGTTSLLPSLEIYSKYNDTCINMNHSPASSYSNHGHDHDFITLIRDPLQLYCSYYYFIYRRLNLLPSPNAPMPHHESSVKMVKDGASLEDFILNCKPNQFMPYIYGDLDPRDFLWVGKTDEMEKSIDMLNRVTHINAEYLTLNCNPNKNIDDRYSVSADVEKKFIIRNEGEYECYRLGLEKFEVQNGALG